MTDFAVLYARAHCLNARFYTSNGPALHVSARTSIGSFSQEYFTDKTLNQSNVHILIRDWSSPYVSHIHLKRVTAV